MLGFFTERSRTAFLIRASVDGIVVDIEATSIRTCLALGDDLATATINIDLVEHVRDACVFWLAGWPTDLDRSR